MMRLITWNNHNELILAEVANGREIPPYAILSHTWGADGDEVTFADLQQGRAEGKKGYKKIQFCSEQAQRDQIKHFWIDTCCINKTDSAELSEAINSMYRWYRDAAKCYVYLSDVPARQSNSDGSDSSTWESNLRASRWFTRGWTLQELLAPKVVEFFSRDGHLLGTKGTLAEQICEITTLPLAVLYGTPPTQFPIAQRWRWAQNRQTSRIEDGAYCLFGIFDVFMPLIYGEGNHAFLRLEKEINARSDQSLRVLMNENRSGNFSGSWPQSTQMQHVYKDESYTERTPKRRRVDQAETVNAQDHRHAIQEGQSNGVGDYDSLLDSLLFDRISFRVNNVRRALHTTCDWLLSHSHFRAWYNNDALEQHNGFFWVKGKPGCGKSTLTKAALEWVQKRSKQTNVRQTIVPYFFNARASAPLEKSALGLYRNAVHHVLSANSALRPLFMSRFGVKDPGSTGDNWTAEELQEFLYDSVESTESFRLTLFIDALDEAEYESDVRQMISFLIQLSDRALAGGSCQLQIFLSSRHYPCISIGKGLSLVVEDQPEHGHDIQTYVSKCLTCPDGPEKSILQSVILQKSARIFLWVVLVVQILNHLDDCGAPFADMQARLETIPTGLNDLFRDILVKSKHGVETTVLLFQWSLFSMRPLEPAELYVAIEYSRSPADIAWVRPSPIILPPPDRLARYILNCSHGLVELAKAAPEQPLVVQFIHETVREFLVGDNGLASIVPAITTNLVGISHEVLRVACFRCVSTNTIPKDHQYHCDNGHEDDAYPNRFESDIGSKLPFLNYACFNLFEHAERAQKHHVSQRAFLETQISCDGTYAGSYRLWWNVLQFYQDGPFGGDKLLLCLLIERRHFELILALLSLPDIVNETPRGQGTALYSISAEGREEEVQMLLEAGADVNKQGGVFNSALQAASWFGHKKVVRMLLEADADVHAQVSVYGTALHIAAWRGHGNIVRMLLKAGADVNALGGINESALSVASHPFRCNIVETLLKAGAAIGPPEKGVYILQRASLYGNEKIVQTLLEADADTYVGTKPYDTALRTASCHGHRKVVHLLLEAGANINAVRGSLDGALRVASRNGKEDIVRMLLKAGADVNARSGCSGSALQAATNSSCWNMVQILLEAGARPLNDADAGGKEAGSRSSI